MLSGVLFFQRNMWTACGHSLSLWAQPQPVDTATACGHSHSLWAQPQGLAKFFAKIFALIPRMAAKSSTMLSSFLGV